MSATDGKKIAIVGGGPGGLTLARLLQLQGAEVRVYERDFDRTARVQGSALDLHHDSGLAALEAAGLMDAFWANHRPELDRLRLTDQNATILYDFMRGKDSGVQRPEIERAPLRNLLLDSLHPDTVHWNRHLESATLTGAQVTLTFVGGESVTADLVVGADGANSKLRPLVTPIRPQDAGVTIMEGYVPSAQETIPEIWNLLGGSALMALGTEQTLSMATKSDGGVLFYAGLKSPREECREQLQRAETPNERLAWFRNHFPGWSPAWEPLFAHTSSLVWRPQRVCPFDQHWAPHGSVTLIGDAAHVMPPYAGEGVNMAMLDALVLSRQLACHDDTEAAVAAYEADMFTRTAKIAERTMGNTEMFYAPDASMQIVNMFRQFAQMMAEKQAVS